METVTIELGEEDVAAIEARSERTGQSRETTIRELLDENKWRAVRHGQDSSLLSRDFSETIPLEEIVHREADRLDIPVLVELLDAESGATRQRRLRETHDDALCGGLRLEHSERA